MVFRSIRKKWHAFAFDEAMDKDEAKNEGEWETFFLFIDRSRLMSGGALTLIGRVVHELGERTFVLNLDSCDPALAIGIA